MATAAENKDVVSRFYNDVFINHDMSRIDEYMRDDYIQHNADCPQGKAGFLEFFDVIFNAVPDFRYKLHKMVAEDDFVLAYSETSGTHTGGEWIGQKASGKSLRFNVIDVFRLEDGLIAEHWDVADTFTFFSQLGNAQRWLGLGGDIAKRKCVRAYADRPVSPEDVDNVVEAGRWAPNAGPFHISVLRSPGVKQRLNDATHKAMLNSGMEFLKMRASMPGYQPMYGAPVAIVLSAPKDGMYSGVNCALAAENIVLQATGLGLASCFIVTPGMALGADPVLATEAGIPDGFAFQCAVLLGHAADSDPYSNPERTPKGTVGYVD
jgi:FMN reductase [NAD(P)H]